MEEKLNQFKAHLSSLGHRPKTVSGYVGGARRFMLWLEKEQLKLESLSYAELLKWVGWQQGRGISSRTINLELGIINKLYVSQKLESPGAELRIRGQRHKVLSELGHLLEEEDLKSLYENYEAAGLSGKRNKSILGILIYQGLKRGELEKLRINDVDLERALIRIPETRMSNSRILDLHAVQMKGLEDYIYQVRPLLNSQNNDRLLISMGTGNKLSNSLSYLIKNLKKTSPKLKSFTQIRQSVITIWLRQYDVRTVQYMAGHRNVSSTHRYKASDLESLQERIEEIHPLNK